jgi:hypothetical protein
MRAVLVHATIAVLAAGSVLVVPRSARACGGCFHQPAPTQVTVVTGHRMAFSVSPQQTVLWDQIEYSGDPEDFAWVLPVMAGAKVELSHDQFFAALDALTDPVITGPDPQCGGGSSGFACGSSASGNASFAAAGSGGGSSVQVLSQSVVGPYDTVTVHSTDPNALYDWLSVNGYAVPASMHPVIDAYVAGGFDFLALRLAPGQGVQAMQPVRVVTPGASLTLPLRMVAAGAGAQVGVTLYVIGEGRYEAQNFPNATVDDSKLVWLHTQNISNYEPLAESAMQAGGGRTWLTEFSSGNAVGTPECGINPTYSGGTQSLASLYYSQCQCAGPGYGDPGPVDAAASDGDGDSGAEVADPTSCQSYDDLAVALTGIEPSTAWVTRLRAILPSNALSEGDLVLQASASQTAVSNQHTALVYDDPTYDPCGSSAANGASANGGGGCTTVREDPFAWSRWLVAGVIGLAGAALARRRRGR